MTTNTYLFEIGLEEVPAKYVSSARTQLEQLVDIFLKENRLTYERLTSFATPRRFAVKIDGLPDKQADLSEIVKGPAKRIALDENGDWTKAAIGFAKGKGASVDAIYFEEIKGEDYVHLKLETPGESTETILSELHQVVTQMSFPVSMHWGSETFKFIRPIHWFVSLFNDRVLPFTFLNVTADCVTRGHRYLGEQEISLEHANDYVQKLRKAYVIANPDERKEMIVEQIQAIATKEAYKVELDEELLEEITQIVEYPTAFIGDFDEKYLSLPAEVLITSMKNHQRYFYVRNQAGDFLPKFISVRNGNSEQLKNVQLGNQKVLTARLEDGLFFVNEDKKLGISDYVKKLETVMFHSEIGTLSEKTMRVGQIAQYLYQAWKVEPSVQSLSSADEKISRTAEIYKFDLVTGIVDEFSELQGIMGEKYALAYGEDPEVAAAIREHYLPEGQDSELPQSSLGILFAVADKLDSVISFFNIGRIPSGSNDPFALRRQMIGIVRILMAYHLPFDWDTDLAQIIATVYAQVSKTDDLQEQLQQFVNDRIKQVLQMEHVPFDVQEAVLGATNTNVNTKLEAAQLLQEEMKQDTFKSVVEAWNRVLNLKDKALQHGAYDIQIDKNMLSSESERSLVESVDALAFSGDLAHDLAQLKALEPTIHVFFENNMVFTEDENVRNNRLALLSQIIKSILAIVDTRKLQIK